MKRFLSILLAAIMILSLAVPVFAYTDTKDNDYEKAIEFLSGLGVINGYEDGSFQPDKVVTRAEMAKLLVVCLHIDTGASILNGIQTYDDVPTTHWANGYINVASQYGLIKGDGDGNFRPDDTVNYAEACTMCIRALGYDGVVSKSGQWPTNFLSKANELKLFDDIEKFNGNDGAKRGTIAQMMWNMMTKPVMWDVISENENDGLTYGKTNNKTMLETKYEDYDFDTLTFEDWNVEIEKNKYVVYIDFEELREGLVYTENDFYKFVPGTEFEVLTYNNGKKVEIVTMYVTDENYLAEGTTKELADKYENLPDLGDGYAYVLLDSSKKSANLLDANSYVTIKVANVHQIDEIKTGKSNIKIKCVDKDITYTIDNDNKLEQGRLTILNGERANLLDLKEKDVFTIVLNGDGEDEIAIASKSVITGEFKGLTTTTEKDGTTTTTIKIDGKEYVLVGTPAYYETKKEKEVKVADTSKLEAKEKDNNYLNKNVTAYADVNGLIVKVVFEEVQKSIKNIPLFLSQDGKRFTQGKDVLTTLINDKETKDYKFVSNYDGIVIRSGSMYYVDFNSSDAIEGLTELVRLTVADKLDASIYPTKSGDIIPLGFGDKINEEEFEFFAHYVDETEYKNEKFGNYYISDETVVYTIKTVLDENDKPDGYTLKVEKGSNPLKRATEGVVIGENGSKVASYVILAGEVERNDDKVSILNGIRKSNSIYYVSIEGEEELELDEASVTKYDADNLNKMIGSIVAYSIDEKTAKIKFVYRVAELPAAGEIVAVEEQGSKVFSIDVETIDNEGNKHVQKIDIIDKKEILDKNDSRIFVITAEIEDGKYEFESVTELKEIDDMDQYLVEENFVAITNNNEYVAIIKGYERPTAE